MLLTLEIKTHLRKVHTQAIGSAFECRREQGEHRKMNRLSTGDSTIDRYREVIGG